MSSTDGSRIHEEAVPRRGLVPRVHEPGVRAPAHDPTPLPRARDGADAGVLRARAVAALQPAIGNAAVGGLLRGGSPAVQRHPEGAGLSVEPDAVVAEQVSGTRGSAPTDSPGAAEAPATEKAPPKPATKAYLDLATAKQVLEKSYGKTYTIKTGKIAFLDSTDAAWAKYDEVTIRDKIPGWKKGSAKAKYPLGLNGFYDAGTGTSYINKASAASTTTPHEMLHANTAAGFRSAVGETLNEGCTQYLTLKALKASSIAVPKNLPYAKEVEVATALVDLVGESRVTAAYFTGGKATTSLIASVDLKMGKGIFAMARAKGEAKDYDAAKILLTQRVLPKKERPPMIDTNTHVDQPDEMFA